MRLPFMPRSDRRIANERATRYASPIRSASIVCRSMKTAPRIGSTRHSATEIDQQMSTRIVSRAVISLASRARYLEPRSARKARNTSIMTIAVSGVDGKAMPTDASTSRARASPSSRCPLRSRCSAERRRRFERVDRARPLRRLLVGARREPPAPRHRERVGPFSLDGALRLAVRARRLVLGAERQRALVQLRRAIERERLARLLGRAQHVLGRVAARPGAFPVRRHHARVGVARALEREGQLSVERAQRLGVERAERRLAHARVVRLDGVAAARPARLDEVRDAQERREPCELAGRHVERDRDRVLGEGRAGHGDELDEPLRVGIERLDARTQRFFESHRRRRRRADHEDVAHDLVDEERVSARLAGDRVDADRHFGRRPVDERARQRTRVIARQRPEVHVPHVAREVHHEGERALRPFGRVARGRALGRDEQQVRRVGRAYDLGEQREAVGVGPLQIVDREDQRRADRRGA